MSHNYLMGCDVIVGGDKTYTDSATVRSVQAKLKALAKATSNSSFDPIEVDGKIGPHTKAAVAAFNKAFGWPSDGSTITAGTLEALKRPDVIDPAGYAAQQAALDEANQVASTAAASPITAPVASAFGAAVPPMGAPVMQKPSDPGFNGYQLIGGAIGAALGAIAGVFLFKKHPVAGAAIGGIFVGPALGAGSVTLFAKGKG